MASINDLVYPKKNNTEKMITPKDVMKVLHIKDRRTFNKLLESDSFPYIKIGRNVLISDTAFNEWLRNYRGKIC